jgi:large subunit ribosomal protein L9
MQVILFRNIEKLGMQGDVVNVAPGYFRNYLGPHGVAVEATPTVLKRLEIKRKRLKEEAQKQVSAASELAKQLSKVELTFTMKSPDGMKLFGSLQDHQIHEQLVAQGFSIERRQVLLRESIKTIGSHPVKVRLIGNVEAQIKVVVKAEGAEAEAAAAKPAAEPPVGTPAPEAQA